MVQGSNGREVRECGNGTDAKKRFTDRVSFSDVPDSAGMAAYPRGNPNG